LIGQEVILVKAGGPLGLSIIGGSDHSCVPFGTGEPGIFISKVNLIICEILIRIKNKYSNKLDYQRWCSISHWKASNGRSYLEG